MVHAYTSASRGSQLAVNADHRSPGRSHLRVRLQPTVYIPTVIIYDARQPFEGELEFGSTFALWARRLWARWLWQWLLVDYSTRNP